MKKYFFLFFIYFFSICSFSDEEVTKYVNQQHEEIFSYLSNNQSLLESDRESFLEQFELRFSKLIPPNEISKRVMGKKLFLAASTDQILDFNKKFKNTLLDSYSGALSNIEASNITLESHFHPNERKDLAVVQLNASFSGRTFKLIY